MKGFIHYSKELSPKNIKKEDPLKCIRNGWREGDHLGGSGNDPGEKW